MTCPDGHHSYPQGTLVCSVCGAKASALARGEALPYSTWSLAAASPVSERARSLTFAVRDSRDGKTWHIREFFPGSGGSDDARKRRFVAAAKSLREAPLNTMRTLFPYTGGGLCYVVTQPVAGASLETLARAQKTSEADAARCLESLLQALVALHSATGAEGPLFIGGFRLSDVIVTGSSLAGPFEIDNSLYLENILAESPLSPEQASGLDVQSAGEVALELATGKVPAAKQQFTVSQIIDTLLGAALEYILHPANGQRPSAKQALLHLELLRKAQASGAAADWKAAFDLSGATRLIALATPRPTKPAPAAGQSPPPPPPAQAGPAPPPFVDVKPPNPLPHAGAPAPLSSRSRRRFILRGCLLSIVIGCGLLIALLVYSCSPEQRSAAPTIDFGVGPSPAVRGQQVTLTWATTGYVSVRINDAPRPLRGSETFTARRKTTYVLVATDKDRHQERREVTLLVQNTPVADAPLPLPQANPPANKAAPVPGPVQTNPDLTAPPADPRREAGEVWALLNRWVAASNAGDPDVEAAFYGPRVERYFLQQNVDNAYVRDNLKHARETGSEATDFSISSPSIGFMDDGAARVTMISNFTANRSGAGGSRQVSTHSELHLRKYQSGWKIVYQRDFDRPQADAPEAPKGDVSEPKPLAPSQPAAATSGILRYSGPPVQFGESISFSKLPKAMLRLSFDRAVWQPQFSRQSDGTQTLTLRSLSHDPQTQCVVVWQIPQ